MATQPPTKPRAGSHDQAPDAGWFSWWMHHCFKIRQCSTSSKNPKLSQENAQDLFQLVFDNYSFDQFKQIVTSTFVQLLMPKLKQKMQVNFGYVLI